MDRAASKKIHFAPYRRQQALIQRLLRDGRYRNVTHFMRSAIDDHLERLGRPSLSEQARQMAEDHERRLGRKTRASLQDASRSANETW